MKDVPFNLDVHTGLCLAFALSFMPIAYVLGQSLIPASHTRNRLLFFWHAYDALTHIFIEGSFLYECFFSFVPIAEIQNTAPGFSPFLNRPDRFYGPAYGTGPSARLWQEYAKADRRWAGVDITVVSLELLTVFIGGPLAIYICFLLFKSSDVGINAKVRSSAKASLWFYSIVLATAELYGGFMTFAPEWLTGCSQLSTEDPVYLWLYLFFFNTLWVFVPIWVLWEAAKELKDAFIGQEALRTEQKKV